MFDSLVPLFLFFLGLSVGSFVNVVVLRFGFHEHVAPRSHCMACNASILWYDLIPVLSFLNLRGKCRSCGSVLSFQYPLVELLVGILFAASYVFLPQTFDVFQFIAFGALLGFLASLVALVVYDIRHTLVPMPFVYALFGFAVLSVVGQSIAHQSVTPLLDALAGGVALAGFFLIIVLVTKGRGMGVGDVYIAGITGVLLGLFRGIEAVMLGVWLATLVYGTILLLSSLSSRFRFLRTFPRVTIGTELPLVPFLALGILLALFTTISPLQLGELSILHTLFRF